MYNKTLHLDIWTMPINHLNLKLCHVINYFIKNNFGNMTHIYLPLIIWFLVKKKKFSFSVSFQKRHAAPVRLYFIVIKHERGLRKEEISACGYNGTSFVSKLYHVTNKNAIFLADFCGHTDRQMNSSGNLCSMLCNVKITAIQLKASLSLWVLCNCVCYSRLNNRLSAQIVQFLP